MQSFSSRFNFKLQTKLTLLIESLIIIIVVVTGIITTMRERETLENELRKRGIALVNDLAKLTARPILAHDLATLRRFVNYSANQDYVRYVIILDPEGKVIMHSDLREVGKDYNDKFNLAAINSRESGHVPAPLMDKKGERYCNIFAPIRVSDVRLGTILIGYSCMAAEKEIAKAKHQIFLIGLITVILGGGIAYLLSTYISVPIKKITDAIEKVSNGDLNTTLSIKRNDEIGTLAKSFNNMAEDLGRHRKHLEILVEARTGELRKANKQLQQEISERTRAEAELKRSQEQLRDLASHLQSIREEERSQIAREIHDELGQALTALKMDVHWLRHKLPKDQLLLSGKIKSMSGLIDTTVQSVRRISSELRPKLLDDLGLSAAMEWQANEFMSRAGIECHISSEPEDIILDQARSTAFFRIFQETLTNIARHAQATEVEVMLQEDTEAVELVVRDNGKGITESQIANAKSLGIIGMRERVHSLGGDLKIAGVPQKGTTVEVRIPN